MKLLIIMIASTTVIVSVVESATIRQSPQILAPVASDRFFVPFGSPLSALLQSLSTMSIMARIFTGVFNPSAAFPSALALSLG